MGHSSRRASYSPRGILRASRSGIWWREGLWKTKGSEHLHEGCSICRLVEGGGISFVSLTFNPSDGDTKEMSAVVEGIVSCELVFQNIFQIILAERISIMLLQTV